MGRQPPAPRPAARRGVVDARLLARTTSTRRFLRWSVAVGVVQAGLVVAQAWLLASIVAGAFVDHAGTDALGPRFAGLTAVVLARAALAWATEVVAHRASATAKSELRRAFGQGLAELGPAGLAGERPGALASLATTGVDALDAYYARYLPQVVLAVVVPVVVVAVLLAANWLAAVIVALTVPLIPLFMVLVGHAAAARTEQRAAALDRLAGHFLDVVAGLPTLRIFRRAAAQAATIRAVTDEYRETTMATLRLAFLSSLVLELLATISVAVVAVAVGLRLLGGSLSFEVAFFVLVAAPEAYLPLRTLGANYHAIGDGVAAAGRLLDVVERGRPASPRGTAAPDLRVATITVEALTVDYPGRPRPALDGLALRLAPGERVAVTGPSGSGKSTLLAVLLGLVTPSRGRVLVDATPLAACDLDAWRAQVAWLPQRPHLFAATLADNVRVGAAGASEGDVRDAVRAARLDEVVARLPDGLATRLGAGGAGLSAGERQRVALARAFLRDAPLVLLDEPTANLDGETEREVLASLARLVEGRTVLVAAHRASLLELVDEVVDLGAAVVA
jgi:thiol reductant ABC exporter CydD subunit